MSQAQSTRLDLYPQKVSTEGISSELLRQWERAENIFVVLPYKVDNISVGCSERDVAIDKHAFGELFVKWTTDLPFSSRREKKPGDYTAYIKAVCDGIESGQIAIATADDLFDIGSIFSASMSFIERHPEAVQHYIATGVFMDALRFFKEESNYSYEKLAEAAFIKLYKYETALIARSKDERSSVYADFLDMPMEVKVSFAGCSQDLLKIEDPIPQ